jgi:glycosyltransferase involved in cell wall biosynthesis
LNATLVLHKVPSAHSGEARPFINWAKAEPTLTLALYQCDFKVDLKNAVYIHDFESLVKASRESDFVVVDDWRVMLGQKVSNSSGTKLAVYAQIPFGLHSLGLQFPDYNPLKTRLIGRAARYMPFSILSSKYRSAMKRAAVVMANSFTTQILLSFVYGLSSNGVVYPPLDLTVFKPLTGKERQIALYLGSEYGDSDQALIAKACKEATSQGLGVHTFGNREAMPKDLMGLVTHHSSITDSELATLYSQSQVVVAPQMHETFGYVPVEAAACGTVSLISYSHDVLLNQPGRIVRSVNEKNFSNVLNHSLEEKYTEEIRTMCSLTAERFSLEKSAFSLARSLET